MSLTETSQQISVESFSYSWLETLNDSFRAALDASDSSSSSFIEINPNQPPARRFTQLENEDFDFNLPFPDEQFTHADELFSNGVLLPLFNDSSQDSANIQGSSGRKKIQYRSSSLKRKMYYLCRNLLEKFRLCGSKVCPLRINKQFSSPRTSVCSSIADFRLSSDSESSIHEAVLHCKRSFGK